MDDDALCPNRKLACEQRGQTMKRLKEIENRGYNVEIKWWEL